MIFRRSWKIITMQFHIIGISRIVDQRFNMHINVYVVFRVRMQPNRTFEWDDVVPDEMIRDRFPTEKQVNV